MKYWLASGRPQVTRVEQGVLDRVAYSERPERHVYRLTAKGAELCDLLTVMSAGETGGPPGTWGRRCCTRHRTCGRISHVVPSCSECHEPMHATDIDVEPGPGV